MARMRLRRFLDLIDEVGPDQALAQLDGAADARAEALARVKVLERRYSLSSAEMKARLERDEIRETTDICHWLFDLETIERTQHLAR